MPSGTAFVLDRHGHLSADSRRETPAHLRRAGHVHEQPRPFGYSSGVDFGEAEMKLRERTAWMLIQLERETRRLPKLRKAWEDGAVSYSNAREVIKVATPDTDAEWTALAAKLPYRGIYAKVHDRPQKEAEQGKRPGPAAEHAVPDGPREGSLRAGLRCPGRGAGQDTGFREFQEAQLLSYRDFLLRS